MKQFAKFLLPLVFVACLAIGIYSGTLVGRQNPPTPTATIPIPPTTISKGTAARNLLVIGVEDLQVESTRLKSIWLVILPQNPPYVHLIPIYPSLSGNADNPYTRSHEPVWLRPRDLESVESAGLLDRRQFLWNEEVWLDDFAFLAALNLASGVVISGEPLSPATALQDLPPSWADPTAALDYQTAMLQSLCANRAAYGKAENVDAFLQLSPSHFYTTLEPFELLRQWERFVGEADGVQCIFPYLSN